MFMIIKRNRIIKTREVANEKYQKLYSDSDFSFPTPDFYTMKYAYEVGAKEYRDTAMVDFLGFFL